MKIKDNFYDFNFKSEEKFVKVSVILFQYIRVLTRISIIIS